MIYYQADLHLDFNPASYNHLKAEDLLIIGGDFLNERSSLGFYPQLALFNSFCNFLTKAPFPVVICSGNHDVAESRLDLSHAVAQPAFSYLAPLQAYENYFTCYARPNKIVDGQHYYHSPENALFSSVPYRASDAGFGKDALSVLEQGRAKLKDLPAGTRWIIVSHVPPRCSIGRQQVTNNQLGSTELFNLLYDFHPDYCISGHVHKPYQKIAIVNKTVCLHAGKEIKQLNLT
jgi:predicted phosphohydrolase